MTVLVDFLLPSSEFVLADALTAVPETRIEIRRVVAGTEVVTPYFWAFGSDLDAFEGALRDDSHVGEILALEEGHDDERFYRVVWRQDVQTVLEAITEAKATILEAVNREERGWELTMLFPSEEQLSDFHDYCVDHDIPIRLLRVYHPENPQERGMYGVTDEQQAAIEAAFHGGYFDVPRDHTLTELAARLDISRNAFSTRLRRGLRNLLSNTLVHEE